MGTLVDLDTLNTICGLFMSLKQQVKKDLRKLKQNIFINLCIYKSKILRRFGHFENSYCIEYFRGRITHSDLLSLLTSLPLYSGFESLSYMICKIFGPEILRNMPVGINNAHTG